MLKPTAKIVPDNEQLQKLFDVPERVGAVPLKLSAFTLFDDITYLGFGEQGEKWATALKKSCIDQGFIPLIEQHPAYGWVFHTLFPPDGSKSVKEIASEFESEAKAEITEKDIENSIASRLKASGIQVRQQVRCAAGVADIVTPFAVFEVKLVLTRDVFFHAVGQALLYRQAINPKLMPYVIGIDGGVSNLVRLAHDMGVTVEFYQC